MNVYLSGFGHAVPERVVGNDELAAALNVPAETIFERSGIRERRYAGDDESVVSLGVAAARDCLTRSGMEAAAVGMVLVASGSADRFCPGPAGAIAAELGLKNVPALDISIASAGSIMALVLASRLAPASGNVLVIATEVMSRRVERTPESAGTAMLFGDGAGAALLSTESGFARVLDTALHTDGSYADALNIHADRLHMDGAIVIRHATTRMPEAILEVLGRNNVAPADVRTFLLHQANVNILTRIARSVGAPAAAFFANIDRYGNTSSASLLIAASEWWAAGITPGPVVFSGFGVGFNWGALLAVVS